MDGGRESRFLAGGAEISRPCPSPKATCRTFSTRLTESPIRRTGEIVERSKKTLTNIRATIHAFFKMCRLKKVSTLFPENLSIPKGARYKGTKILQPQDLITLFSTDTRSFGFSCCTA